MFGKTILSSLLAVVVLTSCSSFLPTPKTQPTRAMETALSIAGTAIAETQTAIPTAIPTATSTATPEPSAVPMPTVILLPTQTPVPTSAFSFSGTPTVIPMDNGLTWSECVVPNRAYSVDSSSLDIPESCIEIPHWNDSDRKRKGEKVEREGGFWDWQITIGNDFLETKLEDLSKGCCSYQLLKNGGTILKMSVGFVSYDPNIGLWNIEGKLVWELSGWKEFIVVDGVNYNEKYQLEGSYFPYEIKGKLIYIAKKDGKYHIVYDDEFFGPEFDDIQMARCCSGASVYPAGGQYWFLGSRAGTKYVVSIR